MRFFQESGYMKGCPLKRPHLLTAVCLIATLVIGVLVAVARPNETECNIVSNLQNLARKTIGLQVFRIVTYLGDFYMWVIFTSIYSIYAYIKSRKHLDTAIELAIFLIITRPSSTSQKWFSLVRDQAVQGSVPMMMT